MVSLITSVYNCEHYIDEMLSSIINQTYENWEMIIIDDASSDETVLKIKMFNDRRIKLVENTSNCGLTHNLNVALKMCQGEYVLRIDGDDIAYTDRLSKQIEYMDEHPNIVLSGCWMKLFGNETGFYQRVVDDKSLRIQLIFDPVILHPTFIFRRSVVDKYSIIYDEELKHAQDYKFIYEISRHGKIGNLPEILVKYRVHDEQISLSRKEEQTRCANKTRTAILTDMGIVLCSKQLNSWFDFCLMENIDQINRNVVDDIIKSIVSWNKENSYYDHDLLIETFYHKYAEVFSKNNVLNNANITESKKYQDLYMFLVRYINNKDNKRAANFLREKECYRIAIYGTSYIAKILYDSLKNEPDINVVCGIDQAFMANYLDESVPIYHVYDNLLDIDAVIVTPFYAYQEIKEMLEKNIQGEIISIEKLFE